MIRRGKRWWGAACLLLQLMAAMPAQAHLLNMTRVDVNLDDQGQVRVTMSLDLMRTAGSGAAYYAWSRVADPLGAPALQPHWQRMAEAMQLYGLPSADDANVIGTPLPLRVVSIQLPTLSETQFLDPLNWPMTHVVLEGRVPSVDTVALQMRFDPAFAFEEPIALTMQNADRARRMTRWLVAGQMSPQFTLYAPGASQPAATFRPTFDADAVGDAGADPMSLLQYVRFGWTHIVPLGWDHVLFVLGLYLGAPTLRRLLLLISVFTVAHSLSLLMAAAAWVRFSPAWVEPLIAVSIVWVAVDNLRAAPKRRARLPIVFGFGLLHGLGFAAALIELGLPRSNFVAAVLCFNLGVEAGQVAVVAAAWLLTGWWRSRPAWRRAIVIPASTVIALIAAAWTVLRVAG